MTQTDSITTTISAGTGNTVQKYRQPTPAEIISRLPKTATPEQQDSAVQRHLRPSEIHWSECPDTLHLPGQTKGKSVYDVNIPQYYKESFFSDKPYFHPELTGGRQGVAGDPVPYTIAGDNLLSSLLLTSFLVMTLSIMRSWRFIMRQIKSFFYVQRANTTIQSETSSEVRFQIVLGIIACLLLSVLFFYYLRENVTETFTIEQYQIIILFTGIFAVYFLMKQLLHSFVNWTFFDKKKSQQWNRAFLFLTASEGVFLMPLVFIQSFFYIPFNSSTIYIIIVIVLFKLLAFFKETQIFFQQNNRFLQIFLYFCTLEIIPLFILWSLLLLISDFLKVIF